MYLEAFESRKNTVTLPDLSPQARNGGLGICILYTHRPTPSIWGHLGSTWVCTMLGQWLHAGPSEQVGETDEQSQQKGRGFKFSISGWLMSCAPIYFLHWESPTRVEANTYERGCAVSDQNTHLPDLLQEDTHHGAPPLPASTPSTSSHITASLRLWFPHSPCSRCPVPLYLLCLNLESSPPPFGSQVSLSEGLLGLPG